jgi:CMP-N-acetylneuraminic acid synthetase
MKGVIAIIPARGGSKRIPDKNIADMAGIPMICHPIKAALESGIFDQVLVSTDSDKIAKIAAKEGATAISRPDHLATDTAFETDAYKDFFQSKTESGEELPSIFCALYPTAVFITADDLKKSYNTIDADPEADALMSVCRYQVHPYKALITNVEGYAEMVHPDHCLERSQTYPEYVASNGTFYWLRVAPFMAMEKPSYYLPRLKTFTLPNERAVDIDEPEDLELARALMAIRTKASHG